jgi:hypothetical protein
MRRFVAWISIPLCVASLSPSFALGKPPKTLSIPDPSNWAVTITYPNGATQSAAIRLRDGTIYPTINNVPSGSMFVDESGVLHILFKGHPKVFTGEAVLQRPRNGLWEGVLTQPTGESRITLRRK